MEIIRKYKPSHYSYYDPKIEKLIGKHTNISDWIKSMGMSDIMIWLQATEYLIANNLAYFEPACKVITLLIKFFILELEIAENNVALSNTQLDALVHRFESILKCEYAYRNEKIEKRNEYTLLKDV